MINYLFAILVAAGAVCAAVTGSVPQLADAATSAAADAVTLCLAMAGGYALWLGLINILKEAGVMKKLSKGMFTVLHRLFPGVPRESAAAEYISLNLTANLLGIGNAATPFGLSAMRELQTLNGGSTVASGAMCTFLVINASSLQLLPLTVVTMRQAAGSAMAEDIILPTLAASAVSTVFAVAASLIMNGVRR